MKINLAECFFEKAEQQPAHPLLLGPQVEDRTDYAEFRTEIQLLAKKLKAAGVNAGSNIGLHYHSGRDYIAFVYAIWACGACVTPLPIELTAQEKQLIFQHIHIDGVISRENLFDDIRVSRHSAAVPLVGETYFAKVESHCEAPPQLAEINAAFIRFTSGTTGNAKGVVLSHESIFARIHAANQALQIGHDDRVLWLLSMDYHFAVSIVAYLTFGAAIILPKNSFGVTLLNSASRHGATLIYGSPTHYSMMTQDNTGATLPPDLRLSIVTTTTLRPEIADTFYNRFGRVLNETYGIIELGLPAINVSHSRAKQGSVGRVLPDYDLQIDSLNDQQEGEIILRSKGMLDAYYSPWKPRECILQESGGWFRTGDIGQLDEDGFLYIVGRSKEMISVGGLKFFPEEVESVLEKHPAIQAACVFGVKDERLGEKAVAQLVLASKQREPDASDLRAYCRYSLATYKIPDQFQWVERLAYTASGKLIRRAEKLLDAQDEAPV